MKKIQDVPIWCNGQIMIAKFLYLACSFDSLKDYANFNYSLSTDEDIVTMQTMTLAQGILIMNGQDYLDWQSNEYAWEWAANKLNVTIIND